MPVKIGEEVKEETFTTATTDVAESADNISDLTDSTERIVDLDTQITNHSARVLANLSRLRDESNLCDVTLSVRGNTFHAHRNVLIASSDYFSSMFKEDYAEKTKAEVELEETQDLTSESFGPLLDFIYTGKLKLSTHAIFELLACSCFLGIESATQTCCDFISVSYRDGDFPFEDYVKISSIATNYGVSRLQKLANSHIAKEFDKVCQTEDFVEKVTPEQLQGLLQRDDLTVKDEFEILHAVLSWFATDWEARKSYLMTFLGEVRLGVLSFDKLIKVFDSFEDPFKDSDSYRDVYKALLKYQTSGEQHFVRSLFPESQDMFVRRKSMKGVLALVHNDTSFIFFNEVTVNLEDVSIQSPGPNSSGSRMIEAEGTLYVGHCDPAVVSTGGHAFRQTIKNQKKKGSTFRTPVFGSPSLTPTQPPSFTPSSSLLRYDILTNTWKQLPRMAKARGHSAMAYHRGYLYVIAGWIGDQFCPMVERYCIEAQQWQNCAKLILPSDFVAGAPIRSTVLVYMEHLLVRIRLIRSDMGSDCNMMFAFDTTTNTWSTAIGGSLGGSLNYPILVDDVLYLVNFQEVDDDGTTLKTFLPSAKKYRRINQEKKSCLQFEDAGDEISQRGIPQDTGLYAFRINDDVYILVGNHAVKTGIAVNDKDPYDVRLAKYGRLSEIHGHNCVGFTIARGLIVA